MIRSSLLLLLFVTSINALAQTPVAEPWARVGIFGGLNVNIHSASFAELEGVPNCCPGFTSGTGIGGAVGLLYEHLLGGPLEIALRAGYQARGATLTSSEAFKVVVGGEPYDGEISHVLESGLGVILIEPILGVRAADVVRFHLGASLGAAISTTFAQREELVKPADVGTFENDRRVRNDTSGTIPNAASFDAGLTLGVSFDVPLNAERTVIASPEAFFTADLTNITTDRTWKGHALRFGVALKYALTREASAPIVVRSEPPSTDATASTLRAEVRALAVAPDGSERSDVTVNVEEFISTNMRPLLNYVFFDESSSTLPDRYERVDAAAFDVARLHSLDAIDTYHHLLNIVGQRLRENPSARVTLVGTTAASGADTGMALSRTRAVAVREYLRSVWAIDTARVRVEARSTPARPSDATTDDGRAENRRVEIVVDDPRVVAPVVTADTLLSVTPPVIRFRNSATVGAGPARWHLRATQHGATLKEFEGSGMPPESIDWETNADQRSVPEAGDSLRYALRVIDRSGREAVAGGALPVSVVTLQRKREERVGDRIIDRYSLILFEYDRADLDAANASIARDIRARIAPEATVTVTGHTDRLGDEAYNQRLSDERAANVARALGIPAGKSSGLGESRLLYDNDYPEGRFYSRTVSIVVETPVR